MVELQRRHAPAIATRKATASGVLDQDGFHPPAAVRDGHAGQLLYLRTRWNKFEDAIRARDARRGPGRSPAETQRLGIAAGGAMLVLGAGAGAAQAAPTWSVDDQVVSEGDSGTTEVTFTITASGLSVLDMWDTVDYTTADGSAGAPGDYAATSGTATVGNILGGTSSTTVKVDVNGDTTPERDETFQLVLSNPSSGTIADGSGQATIVNDDAPHLHVTGTHVSEKDGAAVFTVSLDGAGAVTVHYATADGSAFAGSDYTAQSGTLSFTRSDTAKTVSVPSPTTW